MDYITNTPMTPGKILELIPQKEPFRFVDEIIQVNADQIEGSYTFQEDSGFYTGHFPESPITPGVILIECMAQIGLIGLGIYLLMAEGRKEKVQPVFTSAEVDFLAPVYPGEKVWIQAEKLYFRLNKLKCQVKMLNSERKTVCKGTLAGMMIT